MTLASVERLVISERGLWLVEATAHLRLYFNDHGLPLPGKVFVSTGTPTSRTASGLAPLGECWPSRGTPAGGPRIVVDDNVTDAMLVLAVMVHEMIHAADDCKSSHGPWFAAWATELGLVGSPHATEAGPRLQEVLRAMHGRLGPYPAAARTYVVLSNGAISA